MTYVSLFSGIEAASVAWRPLGWEALAFAEIEPFPCRVLAERFPDVPNLGDVSQVDWSPFRGRTDVVVGGSPCQAFSVAGNRGGLDDPRGRLMLEFVRAVRDIGPRWVIWENVPGVLSQDGGRAYGTLIWELAQLGLSLAWRVLDAEFFGVAQRRRRVFLIASPDPGRPGAVLFEPGCVRGGPGESREKRKALTRAAGQRAQGQGGECLTPGDDAPTLAFPWSNGGKADMAPMRGISPTITAHAYNTPAIAFRTAQTGANGIGVSESVARTMDAAGPEAVAFAQNSRDEVRIVNGDGQISGALAEYAGAKQQTYVAISQFGDVAGTLTARYDSSPCSDRGQNIVCMADTQPNTMIVGDLCGTVTRRSYKDPPVVCVNSDSRAGHDEDVCPPMRANGHTAVAAYAVRDRAGKPGGGKGPLVSEDLSLTLLDHCDQTVFRGDPDGWVVRRLTPTECERLQGFPDGWTDIEGAKDSHRYKAIGNSMAVPVMRWIGERIAEVEEVA